MPHTRSFNFLIVSAIALSLPFTAIPKKTAETPGEISAGAMMWTDPSDISSRNLFYGPGGEKDAPRGTYTFEKEDLDGTNPKFIVRDQDGVKWKVKLGEEARPETVASRLVWAAGYFADEDYFLEDFKVEGMPAHMHRGGDLIAPDGSMHNVRLKRYLKDEKKIGSWSWMANPFAGTREWNGLRVVMALIDNWDLKDINNAIYDRKGADIYLVSDLGASFGANGFSTRAGSKGNLEGYKSSRFIVGMTPALVNFGTPSRPAFFHMPDLPDFKRRVHMEWIGKNVPRSDVKWIGGILAQLSGDRIESAFRAACYSPEEVAGFSNIVEERIAELNRL